MRWTLQRCSRTPTIVCSCPVLRRSPPRQPAHRGPASRGLDRARRESCTGGSGVRPRSRRAHHSDPRDPVVSAPAFERRGGRSRVERGSDLPVGWSTGCAGRAVLMVMSRSALSFDRRDHRSLCSRPHTGAQWCCEQSRMGIGHAFREQTSDCPGTRRLSAIVQSAVTHSVSSTIEPVSPVGRAASHCRERPSQIGRRACVSGDAKTRLSTASA